MSLEQKVNYQLNKYPKVKKVVKSVYEHTMYAISPKIKAEGDITRISLDDQNHEYFFGYYDKSPWDITDRYMLCMRAKDTWSDVSPKEPADILLIDTVLSDGDKNRVKKIATTRSWNVQQSCMLQWLGPDFSSRILYNDFRDDKYVSVILTLGTGEEKIIPAPVYTVSSDGKFALTLDFSRLYNLRPGYGYYNVLEKTKGVALPDTTAVWTVNLETGEVKSLLKYTDFASFQPRKEMLEDGSVHKVNHLMLSPNGKRFMVLYRWFNGDRKYTRLITCNVDGTDMYVLSDDDMVSHCFWRNDSQILAFENKKKGGPGYYLMKDKTRKYIHRWPELSNDGHPSYCPDRSLIVTDTYPDRARIQEIKIMNGKDNHDGSVKVIARVFSPFKYDNDTRVDLHPRWNHKGDQICFDGSFEGHRGLYTVKVSGIEKKNKKIGRHSVLKDLKDTPVNSEKGLVSCVIPSYKRSDTVIRAVKSVLNQTYSNVEVLVVDDNEPGDEYSQALKKALEAFNNDNRVRYISQSKHINGAVARNVGIKEAKGEYIAFLDDDDEWRPDKAQKQVEVLNTQPEIGVVTCLWAMYEKDEEFRKCAPYTPDNIQFKIFLREVAIFTSTVMIRKNAVIEFGGFDETLLRHQDLQFLIDAAEDNKFYVISEYLVKLNTDSEINKPNLERTIKVKRDFFEAEQDKFNRYSDQERKRIINAHNYEVAFSALKGKDYKMAMQFFVRGGYSSICIKDLLKRINQRRLR